MSLDSKNTTAVPRVGVIGAGNWGRNVVRNFHALGALQCVSEQSADLRNELESDYRDIEVFEDYRDLLDAEIDAVAVVTPAPTHFKFAMEALASGKDVFVEKPMTLTSKDAAELVGEALGRDQILMVGHLLLFTPAIPFIKQFIDEGRLGRLYSLHWERKKLGRARYVENVTWSLGVHDIAVLLHLVEEQPRWIYASGHCGLQEKVEDDVYVHMEFVDGIKAHLHSSWLWPENRRMLTIVGEKGMLQYDEINGRVKFHRKTINRGLESQDEGVETVFEDRTWEPLKVELEHFLGCVQRRERPIADGKSGLDVVTVLERMMMF